MLRWIGLVVICLPSVIPAAGEVSVMSFNIRYGTAADGADSWDSRRERVVEAIASFDPDLLGTQEVLAFQRDFLLDRLPQYRCVSAGRDDGRDQGEMTAVFFREERFELLDQGHFWLSSRPDEIGSLGWDAASPRICTWVRLRDRTVPHAAPILLLNTHFDHRGTEARAESARLLRSKIDALADASPVILCGDFNASPGSAPHQSLFSASEQALRDTYAEAGPKTTSSTGTYNGFRDDSEPQDRIDWIGVRGRWAVQDAAIDRRKIGGGYPSDHFPVTAKLKREFSLNRLRSPEVHPDGRVTFRFVSNQADKVEVEWLTGSLDSIDLTRHRDGTWSATTASLKPGIYEYRFLIDGTAQLDPRNRWLKKYYTHTNLLEVPDDPPRVTQWQSVSHGALHHHRYPSSVAGGEREVVVYTPPNYREDHDRAFPVLFLLHGFGDDPTAWSEVGRAHVIADNLIASGKMEPMVIVMPDGHPIERWYGEGDVPRDYRDRNDQTMVQEIEDVLLPWIREEYRVAESPDRQAIVGLSMGGGQSIRAAFATEEFRWVGAFSAAAPSVTSLDELGGDWESWTSDLELFWIACGREDRLLPRNRALVSLLEASEIRHTFRETPGDHNWSLWRDDYLPELLPKLFRVRYRSD